MNEYKILISGSYNVFDSGWDGIGVYMCSGLYKSETFKSPIYIGSSVNLQSRIETAHISTLNRNKHPDNPILQYSWNKHSEKESFVWWLLETCEPDKTLEREQFYLDLYRPFKDEFGGFNINHSASGCVGRKHSKETREKIGKSNTGKKFTEESKKQMSETRRKMFKSGKLIHPQLGKPLSEETKAKLSKSQTGKVVLSTRKRVLCIETGVIYNCIKEAEKILNIKGISRACIGKYDTVGGFHWEYVDEKDKIIKITRPEPSYAKGENSGKARLKEYQIIEIRAKYRPIKYSCQKLADEYGVGRSTIEQIIKRQTWKYI